MHHLEKEEPFKKMEIHEEEVEEEKEEEAARSVSHKENEEKGSLIRPGLNSAFFREQISPSYHLPPSKSSFVFILAGVVFLFFFFS